MRAPRCRMPVGVVLHLASSAWSSLDSPSSWQKCGFALCFGLRGNKAEADYIGLPQAIFLILPLPMDEKQIPLLHRSIYVWAMASDVLIYQVYCLVSVTKGIIFTGSFDTY